MRFSLPPGKGPPEGSGSGPEVCGVSRVAVMGEAEAQHRRAAERRGCTDVIQEAEPCLRVTLGGGTMLTCRKGLWGHADVLHRRRVRAEIKRAALTSQEGAGPC